MKCMLTCFCSIYTSFSLFDETIHMFEVLVMNILNNDYLFSFQCFVTEQLLLLIQYLTCGTYCLLEGIN